MDQKTINLCAQALYTARNSQTPSDTIRNLLGGSDITAGYKIQSALTTLDLNEGRVRAGWKTGLTSEAALKLFKTPEPMVGNIWADTRLENGAHVDLAELIAPKIEGEILIEVGQPCAFDASDVVLLISIKKVYASFEIADSRLTGWAGAIGHAIADNACCARILTSETGISPDSLDLAQASMTLTCDGEKISKGMGKNRLGNPLNVYRWFLEFAHRTGREVKSGDLILTGAIGPAIDIAAP